jgi:hypothetical protein
VQRIWNEVLGAFPQADDTGGRFLDLGGHSLLAIELAARITNASTCRRLKWLLANPTVDELIELLAESQANTSIDREVHELLAEIEALTVTEETGSSRDTSH